MVFDNPEQKLLQTTVRSDDQRRRFKVWHAPGREFDYYGYDPNSKLKYVNVFRWNSSGYFDDDYDMKKPSGVHRIVIVGDSFVEAVRVPLSRSFHNRRTDASRGPYA